MIDHIDCDQGAVQSYLLNCVRLNFVDLHSFIHSHMLGGEFGLYTSEAFYAFLTDKIGVMKNMIPDFPTINLQ